MITSIPIVTTRVCVCISHITIITIIIIIVTMSCLVMILFSFHSSVPSTTLFNLSSPITSYHSPLFLSLSHTHTHTSSLSTLLHFLYMCVCFQSFIAIFYDLTFRLFSLFSFFSFFLCVSTSLNPFDSLHLY